MEVRLNIPKDIERYIEYVPADVLPSILLDMVRESIKRSYSKGSVVSELRVPEETSMPTTSINPNDLETIVAMLKTQLNTSPITAQMQTPVVSQESKEEVQEEVIEYDIKKTITALSSDDEGLDDDLMDLLK